MPSLRHPLLVAAPGVAALALAAVALTRDGDTERVVVTTRAPAEQPAALTFRELYERVDAAVARIDARRSAEDPPFDNGRRVATGAAFLIDDEGHLVTNAHVVERARSATLRFGRGTRRVRARIVGRDAASDLAVVKVDPERLGDDADPLELAPAASIDVGDPVLAVGTPYRLQSSASAGIVSATGRLIESPAGFSVPDAIQTDAAVNPGNSGGPLLDETGRVVGVNTQGRAAGVSFAVSSTTLRRVVPQLIRNGRARTAFLGVSVSEGTRVRTVAPDGPADDAGIRPGDVIRSIGGRDTSEEGAVASAVAARRPGQRVAVRLARRTVTVTLGAQPRR